MKFFTFWLFLFLTSISISHAQEISPWSLGLGSGFSTIGRFNAVPLKNGLPFNGNLNYEISHQWNVKFEYQWIKSEHSGGDSASFQAFRVMPRFNVKSTGNHYFGMESGLGYQYSMLNGIDTVRQIEWIAGPFWNWNVINSWSLQTSLHYTPAFDGFLQSSFQRMDIGVGISYQFGNSTHYNQKSFSDMDQDGVHDNSDECSATPFGMKVGKTGCPLDGDGDLVADYNDFCPDTKGNIDVDEMGCPLNYPGRGVIDGIAFERNSPRLTDTSKSELERIANNLKKFPDLCYVIEGYTSSENSKMERINISKARALTVMNILASYGVPSNKMKAIGLSDQYPLTESKDKNDQILNERIEIKWKHEL